MDSAKTSGHDLRRPWTRFTTTSWGRWPPDVNVPLPRLKPWPADGCGPAGMRWRLDWSMISADFGMRFASLGNAPTCPRMHPYWGQSVFHRWRELLGRRTAKIRGPG